MRQSTQRLFLFMILLSSFFLTNCETNTMNDLNEIGISKEAESKTINALKDKFGETYSERITQGVKQAGARWAASDGTEEEFTKFCLDQFRANEQELDILFNRFQENMEVLRGNLHKINRQFRWALQIEVGPLQPVDYLFR